MSLSTADKVGLGVGAAVLAFVGYEVWKNSKANPMMVYDTNPVGQKFSGTNYKQVVNRAGGYTTVVSGAPEFVYGSYPANSSGTLISPFGPTGTAYDWSTRQNVTYP